MLGEKMTKKLKVFHGLVNYGTQAGLFAKELRNQGVEAISVVTYDPYKRPVDVELLHGGSFFQKIFKHTFNTFRKIYWFFNYNTFHFYYGTSLFPYKLDLPLYRLFNKRVIFHYLGKDVKLYKTSVEKYKISNMAYSSGTPEEALKKDEKKTRRLRFETKYSDLQLVCSPIYSEFVAGSQLLLLAIDLDKYKYSSKSVGEKINLLHAPTSRSNKGTPFIITAVEKLKNENHKVELKICENISHDDLLKEYVKCDVFIDQVLGGYGTAAIEAMALGRPTISYLRDIHFNECTIAGNIPIIRAHKDNIYDVLKSIINNTEQLPQIGLESRSFVEKHHDIRNVTKKLIDIYKNKVWKE